MDTSSYEQLYKLYEDYFKLGIACQAMDHWNDPTAEIEIRKRRADKQNV